MKTPTELTNLLRRYEPDVQAIALAMRRAVISEIGACHESIFPIKKWISILYSTTPKRMKDNICLIVVYRDHVNLMFPGGVDLKDSKGLLEGSGKTMRHVKILTVSDTSRPGVRQLIKQAKKRPGLAKPSNPGKHVVSIIRGMKPVALPPQTAWPKLF